MKVHTLPPPPMNVQNFIDDYVKHIPVYTQSSSDLKKLQFSGLKSLIYDKLTLSKYRSSTIPVELQQKTREKINYCVTSNLPIHITVPFGGYKKWQLPTAPHIDFSEVFNLLQLREYLAPIAAIYKNGVILEYFSDEIFVSVMNNIPQVDIDIYNNEFVILIDFLKPYFPKNFQCKFSKIRDFISPEEIFKRFDEIKKDLREKWKSLNHDEQQRRLSKARRNYKGDADEQTIFESNLTHDAFIFGDWDAGIPWAFDKDMIAIGFRYTKTWGIPLMSSRSSATQFWVGTGAIKVINKECVPTIITYEQYLKTTPLLKTCVVSLFPKTLPALQQLPVITPV